MLIPMWKCPACQTTIPIDGNGPQPNQVYRCSVCRLELVVDEKREGLTVAPLGNTSTKKTRA